MLLATVALWSPRRALVLALGAIVGALAGGSFLHAWSAHDPLAARRFVAACPGTSPAASARAAADLEAYGGRGLCLGPARGVPYKEYAVEPTGRIRCVEFLAWSVPARLWRMLMNIALFAIVGWSFREEIDHHRGWAVAVSLAFWFVLEGSWLALSAAPTGAGAAAWWAKKSGLDVLWPRLNLT